MRMLVFALVILALLLGFGTFSYYYIEHTANSMLADVNTLEQSARAENWNQVRKNFTGLQLTWDKTNPNWTALLDHQELDNINITMSRVKEFMETKDKPGFMTELAELKILIKHIPEKEAINLENIF